jgi:hypothetical protein
MTVVEEAPGIVLTALMVLLMMMKVVLGLSLADRLREQKDYPNRSFNQICCAPGQGTYLQLGECCANARQISSSGALAAPSSMNHSRLTLL